LTDTNLRPKFSLSAIHPKLNRIWFKNSKRLYINGAVCGRYPLNGAIRNSLGEGSSATEDEATFRMLADAYLLSNPVLKEGCDGSGATGSIHGADIHLEKGAMMDYVYFRYGVYMVSTKCCSLSPSCSLSVSLCVSVSVCLSVCLSVSLCVYLCS